MAFKMNKATIAERDGMIGTAQKKLEVLNAAIAKYNDAMGDAWGEVDEALSDFNGALSDTRDFVQRVKDDAETEYDDKSEKWQEGDRGTAAREWIDSFDNVELDEVEIDEPETLDEVECQGLDDLEGLDTEAAS